MAGIKTVDEIIMEVSPYYKKKGEPECEHVLVYNSSGEALEGLYFFTIDLMNDLGLNPEKLVDNFSSTPGGQYYSEIGLKAQRLQDEASKLLATANTVLRSVLNIIYDLKELRTRLEHYQGLHARDRATKQASVLALKQIWLDKVDFAKGTSGIKQLTLQAGFQTLINAFLVVENQKDVDKLDLNDVVKRILKPRIYEFNIWLEQSELELRKRYEIEKNYLRSQINSLKIYSRWIKPYLRAAQQLQSQDIGRNPSLVNLFNTVRMELTLLGKSKIKIDEVALEGSFPSEFKKMAEKGKFKRDYYSCALVEFAFTAIPQQGRFTGKSEIKFRGYALNKDELDALDAELDKSDIADVLTLIEGATDQSLAQLQNDIDEFLEEKTPEQKAMESGNTDQSNPFLALIGYYNKKPKIMKEKSRELIFKKPKQVLVRKENWIEKTHFRPYAARKAEDICFKLFDIYKKSHGMPSYT